jgi:hypothetical protein
MARFLKQTYTLLAKTRKDAKIGVSRAYWYTWASNYGRERIWNFTGLIRHKWSSDKETVKDTPSLHAFRKIALRAEGRR